MLTFNFSFAKMRRQLMIRSAATLAGVALLAFAWYLLESHVGGRSWARGLGLIPLLVLAPVYLESTRWAGVLLGGRASGRAETARRGAGR